MVEHDDFLSRWSRRKAEARTGLTKKPDDAAAEPVAVKMREDDPAFETRILGESGDVALREGADAPETAATENTEEDFKDFDFDKLDYQSDYTKFMKKGVPDWARQRALSKLWVSDPILANLDGLIDYGEDFTDAALAVKELITAHRVGQGYLTDEEVQFNREQYGPEDQKLAARKEREDREAAEARKAQESGEEDAEAGDDEIAVTDADETPPQESTDDSVASGPDNDDTPPAV